MRLFPRLTPMALLAAHMLSQAALSFAEPGSSLGGARVVGAFFVTRLLADAGLCFWAIRHRPFRLRANGF